MDSDKATISELKAILKYLDLSTKGNKSELLKRLYEHDSSDSWKRWIGEILVEETLTEVRDMREATTTQRHRDVTTVKNEVRQEIASRSSPRSDYVMDHNYVMEWIDRDRELEILRRECNLMQWELEILHRELEANRTAMIVSPATIASQTLITDCLSLRSLRPSAS